MDLAILQVSAESELIKGGGMSYGSNPSIFATARAGASFVRQNGRWGYKAFVNWDCSGVEPRAQWYRNSSGPARFSVNCIARAVIAFTLLVET